MFWLDILLIITFIELQYFIFIIQPPKSAQGKQKLSKAEKEKLKAEEEARKAEEEGKFIERKKNCF